MIAGAYEYFMIRGKRNMKKDEPVPNHHMRTLIPLKNEFVLLVLHVIIIDFFIFLTMYLVDEDEISFVISMQNVVSQ